MATITGLDHVCIKTKDRQMTIDFYRDILGFEELRTDVCDVETITYMKCGDFLLEIIQPNPEFIDDIAWDLEKQSVLNHIGLKVDDIDGIYEALKAKGVQFKDDKVIRGDQPRDGLNVLIMYDPNGVNINLYDFKTAL